MERTTQVQFLSEGILSEILHRLPTKSVFRFKSVSKAWFSLISDSSFVRSYTRRASASSQPTPWTLLQKVFKIDHDLIPPCRNFRRNIDASRFDQDQPSLSELTLCSNSIKNIQERSTLDHHRMYYEIAAISNGFLLCRLYSRDVRYLHYCMINPITWQRVELPPLLRSQHCPVFAEGFLAQVDQALGIFQRYIVVLPKHSPDRKTKHHRVEVFSSKTGRWTECSFESPTPFEMISTISFPANERIHWYCSSGWQTNNLIAYDPLDDCNSCRVIQFPSDGRQSSTDCIRVLDEFQGRLRCIRSSITNHGSYVWEVWTLIGEFEEGNWTLVHRITESDDPLLDGAFLPISNPDPNIFYFRGKREDELVSYNIQTRECKVMDDTLKLDTMRLRNCRESAKSWMIP